MIEYAYQQDKENENDQKYIEVLNKFNLTKPLFSDTWIKLCVKRICFSWSLAHFARRGAIDQKYPCF